MVLALVAPGALWWARDDGSAPPVVRAIEPSWRNKSAGTLAPPVLRLFHGRVARDAAGNPRPEVLGALGPLATLAAGDAVLFRVSVAQACEVRLSLVRGSATCTLLGCETREHLLSARLPAGEHELAANGLALAYVTDRAETLRFRLAIGEDAPTAELAAARGPQDAPTVGGAAVDAAIRVVGPTR